MRMANPPHPGKVLYELFIKPADLTITEVADRIGKDRSTVSGLVNGNTSMTIDMAIRIAKAFGTSERMWLDMQTSYNLWHSKKMKRDEIKKIKKFRRLKRNTLAIAS